MRREYKGVGYVPHGFLSELQVAWSSGQGAAKHYARQEDALASSPGSHPSLRRTTAWKSKWWCRSGRRSPRQTECRWQRAGCASVRGPGSLRVWRVLGSLFQRVTDCVERKAKDSHCALLLTNTMVPLLDGNGAGCH